LRPVSLRVTRNDDYFVGKGHRLTRPAAHRQFRRSPTEFAGGRFFMAVVGVFSRGRCIPAFPSN
jgi:hypothetical protein